MSVRCRDILALPALKDMKIVAGMGGLDRILRWVHVSDVPKITQWVHGGELLFTTGMSIREDVWSWLQLIKDISEKNLAGLVINVGPYISHIPHEVKDLADSLDFPVFELPWEIKLVDVTQSICNYIIKKQAEEKSVSELLNNILFGNFKSTEVILKEAEYYGYNLNCPHCVCVVDIDGFGEYLKRENIRDEKNIVEIKSHLHQIILNIFEKYGKKVLSMLMRDSVIFMWPCKSSKDKYMIKNVAEDIRQCVAHELAPLTVSVGIGRCYRDLKEMGKSLKEAERAIKFVNRVMGKDAFSHYNEMGLFRLLFEVQDHGELKAFYDDILGPLRDYDEANGTELLNTLEAFLRENGNMVKTAGELFIHRSTLNYRLQRIQDILKIDLSDGDNRFNLKVALMIGKFLDSAN
ncbi:PucR family transcriptional regulator [Caldanaerobius polysaccharolyticus]|uniref:PucR family transcriptional regulator n=1 Tax=Caldanaerobius polysaccharolyticus TaxID=44256 RepID=UPI000479A427|nr:PucR family transcriptional regulator [Caldanaerobius polysaccharolyticus]